MIMRPDSLLYEDGYQSDRRRKDDRDVRYSVGIDRNRPAVCPDIGLGIHVT